MLWTGFLVSILSKNVLLKIAEVYTLRIANIRKVVDQHISNTNSCFLQRIFGRDFYFVTLF